jgi:hypothetical protein
MRIFLLTLNLVLLALLACKDQEEAIVQPSIYENCCGTEAVTDVFPYYVEYSNGHGIYFDSMFTARVFIPNIIIHDDPDNQYFTICCAEVVMINSLKIYSDTGELLFENTNFLPNDPSQTWAGLRPDGVKHFGRFDYDVDLRLRNGSAKTYKRQACAYQCNAEGFPVINLSDCKFFSQNDGNGGYDSSLAMPTDCF